MFPILKKKRAQAAMEFLMTYGWAILVVLGAVITLSYFGVMKMERFAPDACTIPTTSGMGCIDFKMTETSADIFIMNSGGRDLRIHNISVGPCVESFNVSLPNGKSHLFSITGCSFGSAGSRVSADLIIIYEDQMSEFVKTVLGSLLTMIN